MTTLHQGTSIAIVRLSIPVGEFPALLASHVSSYRTTAAIEKLGAGFVANGFPIGDVKEFVEEVCRWGNYAGVAGKVLKRNKLVDIRDRLKEAHAALSAGKPKDAIQAVTSLHGFAISFGSKHLKFLSPTQAVVLDSVISERLGFLRTPDGYVEFLTDCISIRDVLNRSNVAASASQNRWRVSDVEMAIFMRLRS